MTTTVENTYEQAVAEQLKDRGSVTVTSVALSWLLGAAVRPADPLPPDDLITLWRALHTADPDLATARWRECWDSTPTRDRLPLLIVASRIPDLDTH